MNITKKKDGGTLTVALEGRLDTNSAMELEKELGTEKNNIDRLIMDFAELAYISSSGLRLLLGAYKALKGNMKIINVRDEVKMVFDTTGFTAALDIE